VSATKQSPCRHWAFELGISIDIWHEIFEVYLIFGIGSLTFYNRYCDCKFPCIFFACLYNVCMDIKRTLDRIESIAQLAIVALFPLVFFPFFADMVGAAKLYFLASAVLLLLALKAVKIVVTKQIEWKTTGFETPLTLFAFAYILSALVSAPNKVMALADPARGALVPVLFVVLYFLIPKNNKAGTLIAAFVSLFLTAAITALVYFNVFSFVPDTLGFLKVKSFTTVGSYVYLIFFAAFLGAILLPHVTESEELKEMATAHGTTELKKARSTAIDMVFFVIALVTAIFSSYVLFKEFTPQIVSYAATWQTFVETLKTLMTALFGVGPGNFLAMFTIAKPATFNASGLWSINPDLGGSALLHIGTETGMLGLFTLATLLFILFKKTKKSALFPAYAVLLAWFLFVPLSQMTWWALFLFLILTTNFSKIRSFNAAELPVIYIALAVLAAGVVAIGGYFEYRGYMSQSFYYQSLIAAQANQAQQLYDLQNRAIIQNPYNEQTHLAFSQTNLLLANSLSQKKNLTDADKQSVSQLIQQGIQEARNVVILNPQKAVYWANLGETYRSVLTVAQGADVWAISSYQRAIALDPRNPQYYFNLGSVYYGLKNYDEAVRFFSNAVSLKTDIPNYHYNLAWAYYQKQDYTQAVNAMQNTLQLIPDKKSADYKTAQKNLEEFQKMVKETQPAQDQAAQNGTPETLSQPSPIPSITPEISLSPNNAPPQQ